MGASRIHDGTMTLKTVYHGLGSDMWDAADLSTAPHASTYASERKDGHGRSIRATERAHAGNVVQARHVLTDYSPTGQPEIITRRLGSTSASDVTRWMRYDSLGRMVLNVDPHTSSGTLTPPASTTPLAGYAPPTDLRAWTYLYNQAGDLIGTEDARGTGTTHCGVGFAYDALGRLLGEDYFPCESGHEAYSAANVGDFTTNWEVVYYYDGAPPNGAQVPTAICNPNAYPLGRLVAVRDRVAETTTCVDGRGRVTETTRRIGTPLGGSENVAEDITARYVGDQWFYKRAAYDAADRPIAETTGGLRGTSLAEFAGADEGIWEGDSEQDTRVVRTNYTARGTVKSIDGSYGTLVKKMTRRADGLVTNLVYGDSAGTQTTTLYDDRRRPTSIQTFRGTPGIWGTIEGVTYTPPPTPTGAPSTFQLLLEDTDSAYDEVGNPVELRDWREASEWPAGSKPTTKKIEYDDLYRVRRMDYLYATSTGMDSWKSPFEQENNENPLATPAPDTRRARPVPHLNFTNRPNWQSFEYDWLGNLSKSDDDAHGGYDRSLGVQSHSNANKPYQLSGATNSSLVDATGITGTVNTAFDAAGNMTRMTVARPNSKCGQIYISGALADAPCSQYYAYDYDEVGRLYRARRWDFALANLPAIGATPGTTAAVDLRYRYDASDQRVIKRTFDGNAAKIRHTLYVFGSFELHRTTYTTGPYVVDNKSAVPYLMAHGVRLARLHFDDGAVPKVTGLTEAQGGTNTPAPGNLHVLLELGDHLGSTGTVLDKASGELVEKTGYLPFGARENDYRPSRWAGFREDYGFTGKEEDVEVGLTYFGKRYLSAQLGRWVTADPLAVHAPGQADFNLYAYVSGAVLKSVDPVGLAADSRPDQEAEGRGNVPDDSTNPSVAATANTPRLEPVDNRTGSSSPQSATGEKEYFDNDPGREVRKSAIVAGAVASVGNPIAMGVMALMGSVGASDSGRKDLEIKESQAFEGMSLGPVAATAYRWFTAAESPGIVSRAIPKSAETVPEAARGAAPAPGEYLAGKAPKQVTPGTRSLEGQYVNDQGRVEPWTAHFDDFGRQVGRTDFNAGNKAQGIPDTHHHTYDWTNIHEAGKEVTSHVPGEYKPQ